MSGENTESRVDDDPSVADRSTAGPFDSGSETVADGGGTLDSSVARCWHALDRGWQALLLGLVIVAAHLFAQLI